MSIFAEKVTSCPNCNYQTIPSHLQDGRGNRVYSCRSCSCMFCDRCKGSSQYMRGLDNVHCPNCNNTKNEIFIFDYFVSAQCNTCWNGTKNVGFIGKYPNGDLKSCPECFGEMFSVYASQIQNGEYNAKALKR